MDFYEAPDGAPYCIKCATRLPSEPPPQSPPKPIKLPEPPPRATEPKEPHKKGSVEPGQTELLPTTEKAQVQTAQGPVPDRDADAQFNLGVMYDTGEGVPQDDAEAVRWFRLAAEQGVEFASKYLADPREDPYNPATQEAMRRGSRLAGPARFPPDR